MDRDILRDYLGKVRELETDIYTMDESIEQLQRIRKHCEKPRIYAPKRPELPQKNKIGSAPIVLGALGVLGATPLLPIAAGVAIWKNSKVNREHEAALGEYNKEVGDYEEKLRKNAEEEKLYQAELERVEQFNRNLDNQIRSIEENKAETQQALQKLYDLGIIYPKYRSLIPVSMFCEYMDSKRRSVLEGKNEMYDLYEQELLGKLIVGELTDIKNQLRVISCQLGSIAGSLTSIQRNQMLVYEEVAKGNRIAEEICQGTKNLLESQERHLSALEESAEKTAFHTAAAERRMDALARVAQYEFAAKNSPYILP